MKLKYYFQISLLKSIFFNFRVLPFKKACRLPVLLFRHTRIKSLKGKLHIDAPCTHAMIKIGRADICGMETAPTVLQLDGEIHFKGKATIGSGSVISVDRNGCLIFGNKYRITGRSTIFCRHKISFGNNVLISWDNLFMDHDHHDIMDHGGNIINPPGEIITGDHVWFGCRSTILKGCRIPADCVVAANSLLTGNFTEENSVIGGSGKNRQVLRSGIEWKE